MKRVFTLSIEDGTTIEGLQIAVAVRRESDGETGVTFFSITDDIRENDEWLFKTNGKAERIVTGEPTGAESEDKNDLK